MFRSSSVKKKPAALNEAEILSIFDRHADVEDPESMAMDGIGTLCESLGLDASSDVKALVLVWRLGAVSKPGLITKSEFISGMEALRKDSIAGLVQIVPSLDPGFLDRAEFRGSILLHHLINRHKL